MTETIKNQGRLYEIKGKVEKFQDKVAVISTTDNQKLLWPIKNLPEDCQVGQEIRLTISTEKTDQAEREQLAKTLLNQILKKEPT